MPGRIISAWRTANSLLLRSDGFVLSFVLRLGMAVEERAVGQQGLAVAAVAAQ